MSKFIDSRTSQNASTSNSIAIPILLLNTPQLFGQIGLLTAGVGPNPRVVFSGTISIQVPLALAGITVRIVRGTAATDPIVYSATSTFDLSLLAPQIINFTATDFNPPVTPQLTYSAFVISNLLGTIRVGPETFNGQLYSD